MLRTSEQLERFLKHAPHFVENQDRAELRFFVSCICGVLYFIIWEPWAYVRTLPDSILFDVARTLTIPYAIEISCIVSALLLLPYTFCLLFLPETLHLEWPRKWAASAAFLTACLWVYLAWATLPLDFGPVWKPYAFRACGASVFAVAFMRSVNVQQIRTVARHAEMRRALRARVEEMRSASLRS